MNSANEEVAFRIQGEGTEYTPDTKPIKDGILRLEVYKDFVSLLIGGDGNDAQAAVINGVVYPFLAITAQNRGIALGTDYTGEVEVVAFPSTSSFALVGNLLAGALSDATLCYVPPTCVHALGVTTLVTIAGTLEQALIDSATGAVTVTVAPNAGDRIRFLGCAWLAG
jgi:hypothetical protein